MHDYDFAGRKALRDAEQDEKEARLTGGFAKATAWLLFLTVAGFAWLHFLTPSWPELLLFALGFMLIVDVCGLMVTSGLYFAMEKASLLKKIAWPLAAMAFVYVFAVFSDTLLVVP